MSNTTNQPAPPRGHGETMSGLAKLGIAVVTFIIVGMVGAMVQTVSTVTGLQPQIEQMQRTQEQHDQWIADWPLSLIHI